MELELSFEMPRQRKRRVANHEAEEPRAKVMATQTEEESQTGTGEQVVATESCVPSTSEKAGPTHRTPVGKLLTEDSIDQGGPIQQPLNPDPIYRERKVGHFSDPGYPTNQGFKCFCTERQKCILHLGYSPINVENITKKLKTYTNTGDAKVLINGFQEGFKIEYTGSRSALECRNLKSAFDHKEELNDKVNKELQLGRLAGPFDKPPFPNLRVSPVGLVPKSDGGWRMITHLSYPYGSSINDGIDNQFCTVRYTSFDSVTDMIYNLGKSALIAKRDLKSAYRIIPIRVQDFPLLGIKANGKYYIDKCLPMGLSQSANLFEKFSSFLQWLVCKQAGTDSMAHLLDDFLFAGSGTSETCWQLVNIFEELCSWLGVPIATEKSVDPTTIMIFLGLEINTNDMSVRIPGHKIIELEILIKATLNRRKISLRELQSLVGKLNFFGQAVRSSRAFLRRFYDAMLPLKKPHHMLRVSQEMREDLSVWLKFLHDFNGVTYIPEKVSFTSETIKLFTDAAGSAHLGSACFLNNHWCFFPWPDNWTLQSVLKDLTFLEMIPVVLAICLWGDALANKNISLYIDNESLVHVINRQTSKSTRLMQLIRFFVLQCMKLNIMFRAIHIFSKQNPIADAISRRQWGRFRMLAPEADRDPSIIPQQFLSMISMLNLGD